MQGSDMTQFLWTIFKFRLPTRKRLRKDKCCILTHRERVKLVTILQTTFSNSYYGLKFDVFQLEFHTFPLGSNQQRARIGSDNDLAQDALAYLRICDNRPYPVNGALKIRVYASCKISRLCQLLICKEYISPYVDNPYFKFVYILSVLYGARNMICDSYTAFMYIYTYTESNIIWRCVRWLHGLLELVRIWITRTVIPHISMQIVEMQYQQLSMTSLEWSQWLKAIAYLRTYLRSDSIINQVCGDF